MTEPIKNCLYCGTEFEDRTTNDKKKYCSTKCKDKYYYWNKGMKEKKKNRLQELKKDIIMKYSDGKMECECCGNKNIEFLTIDHIDENGAKERRKHGTGHNYYRWLKKNDYPTDLNLRCYA